MTEMNMIQSLNSALDNLLEMDQNVVVFGEDVGYFGGVFRVTDELQQFVERQNVMLVVVALVAVGPGLPASQCLELIQGKVLGVPLWDHIPRFADPAVAKFRMIRDICCRAQVAIMPTDQMPV